MFASIVLETAHTIHRARQCDAWNIDGIHSSDKKYWSKAQSAVPQNRFYGVTWPAMSEVTVSTSRAGCSRDRYAYGCGSSHGPVCAWTHYTSCNPCWKKSPKVGHAGYRIDTLMKIQEVSMLKRTPAGPQAPLQTELFCSINRSVMSWQEVPESVRGCVIETLARLLTQANGSSAETDEATHD